MSTPRSSGDGVSAQQKQAGPPRFAGMLALDVVLPLVVYYALRAGGANACTALVVGAGIPLLRVVVVAVRRRRLEAVGLFTVSLLAVGTAAGLVTADPRLLMARESYLTAVVGLWILATLRAPRPLVYTATTGFMPAAATAAWQRAWDTSRDFRRVMRGMTLAFGLVFLTDAAARPVLAYTLPLDLVPVLSTVLVVVLLLAVVQAGKAYGKRHLGNAFGATATAPAQRREQPTKRRGHTG